MMGALMLPSAAPMILTFAAAQARRDRNVPVPTWMFVAGYILVWGYAGVVVFVLVYAGKDLVDRCAWPERLTSAQSQLMALQQVLGNSRVTARGWNCDDASRVSAACPSSCSSPRFGLPATLPCARSTMPLTSHERM